MENKKTLLISDLHLLGKFPFPTEKFIALTQDQNLERIILLGDIFHNSNFGKINPAEQKFIQHVRSLKERDPALMIVVIAGNHDKEKETIEKIIGIPLQENYQWETEQGTYLAVHGHQFYNFEKEKPIGGKILLLIQEIVLRVVPSRAFHDWKNKIGRIILRRIIERVRKQAREYAKTFGAHAIFCGHVHFEELNAAEEIIYCNTGTWKDMPVPVVFVTKKGDITLEYR